jgi:lipopolysaccharide transport system permease protein
MSSSTFVLHIRPRKGWQSLELRELWLYRELLGFLVWRDIKIRYRQTFLGGLWALLQPLIAMLLFGALFGRVTGMNGGGHPYPLFVFAGLVPWTFFANAIGLASNSLVGSEQMIRKIYFPRVFVPLGTIAAFGLDVLISLAFMAALMLHYRFAPGPNLIYLPIFVVGVFLVTSGLGLMLAAINVRYRDVKYVVPFLTQMAFFITPVIYPISYVPAKLRWIVSLNPLTGIVEGFRYALLGGAVSWVLVSASLLAACAIFALGLSVFLRMQRIFADVI